MYSFSYGIFLAKYLRQKKYFKLFFKFQPESCPTIINGTITEYDEEETEETEKILDEISTEPVENQFQQYRNGRIVKNSMYNQQQNYNSGNLYGQRNNIPGKQNLERMKPLSEEEKEEEIEKPNVMHINIQSQQEPKNTPHRCRHFKKTYGGF